MFCRQQVAQLRGELDEIRKRGAELVLVGNGSVEQARAFRDQQGLTVPLFTDPSLQAYSRAGLRRDLAATIDPRIALRGIRALTQGFRQSSVLGDAFQQGGVFVIGTGGRVLYQHVSRYAGDNPDPADILQALS